MVEGVLTVERCAGEFKMCFEDIDIEGDVKERFENVDVRGEDVREEGDCDDEDDSMEVDRGDKMIAGALRFGVEEAVIMVASGAKNPRGNEGLI
jgi:hypothetical protein